MEWEKILTKHVFKGQVKNIYNSVTRNPTTDKKKEKKKGKAKEYSTNEDV